MDITFDLVKEKIQESDNINALPLIRDFNSEDIYDIICDEWIGTITIADGTEIELIHDSTIDCFNDKEDWYFYYIKDIDTYICAECGLWQKDYENIKNEIGYYDGLVTTKLLPYDWNEQGIRTYFKRGIQKQKE